MIFMTLVYDGNIGCDECDSGKYTVSIIVGSVMATLTVMITMLNKIVV